MQLDEDSSGNISKDELIFAMKKMCVGGRTHRIALSSACTCRCADTPALSATPWLLVRVRYGKPLKPTVIDKMMLEADADNDGEISFVEFEMLMLACENDKEKGGNSKGKGGVWSVIKERGMTASREQKATADMRLRRITNSNKLVLRIERRLAEATAHDPSILLKPSPWLLPAGGGLPPKAQVQHPPSPEDRTYNVAETLRRLPWSKDRSRKQTDVEEGLLLDAPEEVEAGCFTRMWQALPSPGEAVASAFDFFENYVPLLFLLSIPASALMSFIRLQIDVHYADSNTVAPPPPPATPDFMTEASENFFALAQEKPGTYLFLDLGLAFAIGVLTFYWKDIGEWMEEQRMRGSYQKMEDGEDEGEQEPVVSTQVMRMQLYKEINMIEEIDIKLRVYPKSKELVAQLKAHQARRAQLEKVLAAAGSADDQAANSPAKKAEAKSDFSIFMSNMSAGLVEVSVYFADIISDVQVLILLYTTGNVFASFLSLVFLVAQFAVIYIRVLPYLNTTFGNESTIYQVFLWIGFPVGCLGLDVLMFLEPFGLLAVLPLPTWLKTFVPAYKATRVICEVFIESLPQTLLQSYMLISIMGRVHAGNPRPSDTAFLPEIASLPQSITISTLSTLKTWISLVDEANKAGISIKAKAWQLWNVGGGLPLDALKKGAIDEWTCSYKLDEGESECHFAAPTLAPTRVAPPQCSSLC